MVLSLRLQKSRNPSSGVWPTAVRVRARVPITQQRTDKRSEPRIRTNEIDLISVIQVILNRLQDSVAQSPNANCVQMSVQSFSVQQFGANICNVVLAVQL